MKSDNPILFFLGPIAFSLIALLMPTIWDYAPVSLSAALVFLGIGHGYLQWRYVSKRQHASREETEKRQQQDQKISQAVGEIAQLEQLVIQILPLWQRNVGSCKNHTEENIQALTERFAALATKLQSAMDTNQKQLGSQLPSEAVSDEQRLRSLFEKLSQLLLSKSEMNQEIQQLHSVTKDLNNMAEAVSKIAEQTNLLALNAAIEAARAGENGRGFAVVADEVRALSTQSNQTGEKIAQRIQVLNDAMQQFSSAAEATGQKEVTVIKDGEQIITAVLENIKHKQEQLEADTQHLLDNDQQAVNEINELIVSLQFQDRVSQILSQVIDSQKEIEALVDQRKSNRAAGMSSSVLNIEQLLAKMEVAYTTSEQRANHTLANTGTNNDNDGDSGDVQFF